MAEVNNLGGLLGTPMAYHEAMHNVVGRPFSFLDSTDPFQRSFTRHMLPGAPIVKFRPGHVKFQDIDSYLQKIKDIVGLGTEIPTLTGNDPNQASSAGIFDSLTGYGVSEKDIAAIETAIANKQAGTVHDITANGGSMRFFEFDPAISEYNDVVATLSSRLYSRMKGSSVAWANVGDLHDASKTTNNGFYSFWADNASSVSESASNMVEATTVSNMVRGVTDISKQMQYFLRSDFSGAGKNDVVGGIADSIAGMLGSQEGGGLAAGLGDAVLGLNPLFPEVWKDSSFSRSYNISFKFHSPYGAPGAIFQNVLLPFCYLLGLCLPMMKSPASYTHPFVFQLDCPGYFACDLGICTDFSFVKGGSENLWTIDGLPRAIDVTLQVKDLYPTLAASHNSRSLFLNVGLSTFLDNMVGISLNRAGNKADPITMLRYSLNRTLSIARNLPDVALSSLQYFILEKQGFGKITSLFK
jgi:hypothetical protein